MLAALRSFAVLAAPPAPAAPPGIASPSAGAAGAIGTDGNLATAAAADPSAAIAAPPPAFVLPANVVDALAGDITARHLQYTKLERSEVNTCETALVQCF